MSATPAPSGSSSHPTTSLTYRLPNPPQHPVSSIAFHPDPSSSSSLARQFLLASWDSTVRLYQLPSPSNADGEVKASQIKELVSFRHEVPVLDVCWINEDLAASGGIDRRVRILNLATGESTILGKHLAPISRIRYSPHYNLLFTSSWDKTLQIWDPLSSPPRHLKTLPQSEKILAMDLSPPWPSSPLWKKEEEKERLVVGMIDRKIRIYEVAELKKKIDQEQAEATTTTDGPSASSDWPHEQRESSLKHMIRDIRCNPLGDGFTTSSIEGRVAVDFFDQPSGGSSSAKNYAFKCHRITVDEIDVVYPVNCVGFHPIHGSFFTVGGDGILNYWDPSQKKRIRALARYPTPLSTAAFSSDGEYVVIASGGENLEEREREGERGGNPEVGGLERGGEGRVEVWIRERAGEEARPKVKS